MLRLKNVKIGAKFAEADYYPETSEQFGHIMVNLADESIVEMTMVEGFSGMHPAHARQALIEMARTKDTRTERLIMWY